MKVVSSILAFLFFASFIGNSQQGAKTYFFEKIGWTISLPADFTVIDSLEDTERNKRGQKTLEEAGNLTVDISKTITLISATKNTYNYFNATITPLDSMQDSNWDSVNQVTKKAIYTTIFTNMPNAKIDSLTTSIIIDGLKFDNYKISVTIDNKVLFTSFVLSRLYKGFDFAISYVYLDEETKEQIESVLLKSKFSK